MDAALADLHGVHARLVAEIRASDDASAARDRGAAGYAVESHVVMVIDVQPYLPASSRDLLKGEGSTP